MKNYDLVEILIVEDNPNDAELTVRALKENSLANDLFVVEDGEEALDFLFCKGKYASRNPSKFLKVIFLDLKLPRISGLEALREIRSNPLTKYIPVVVVTSSKEDPDIKESYNLGANAYVVKPMEFDNFVDAIQQTGLFWLLVNETTN